MTTQDSDLLRQFLADETESFAQKRQGKFWPRNHHRLRPLLPKAAALLDPAEYEDLRFHLLRVTGGAPAVAQKDISSLLTAYRRLIPHLDTGGIIQMARRHARGHPRTHCKMGGKRGRALLYRAALCRPCAPNIRSHSRRKLARTGMGQSP
ncbi:hypothetical protein M3484_04630 [Pseudomonas sp. GX19020]|uniref:hypothetical protein n=1 Tax=Pseudomonas sp. GX19020 TaxID=2942277 RepID=UPI002019DCB4|nr:hypothetical protein [Pseudomonas sp. GX19020]MCL4065849.1 hypothetical protein [Pseudomonas sp. GX19020]